ncbi:MAG: Uma2 family endonuclease [Defluviitaleaceae bacterium]|nr:Uma2 family endonuclease [Defluviitaleaceae bacterium]
MSAIRKPEERYTYSDLANWPEDERWELIDGVPYAMAAPNTKHQRISMNLSWKFREYLEGKGCEVFAAPFDVRLNFDEADDIVLQPDLLVVCDKDKIDEKGCNGAPDLVIEILSPSNTTRDTILKLQKYRNAHVREIWFVDPDINKVQVFKPNNGEYSFKIYDSEDTVPVDILPEFSINMKEIF